MSEPRPEEIVEREPEAAREAARELIARGEATRLAGALLMALTGESLWRAERALDLLATLADAAPLIPHFEGALRDGSNPDRRNAARGALGAMARVDSPHRAAALAALAEIVLEDADADARILAAGGIGDSGNPDGLATLERVLDDEDPNVGAAAAEALGLLGDDRAIPALGRAVVAGSFWIRASAILALGRLGSDAALEFLAWAIDEPLLAGASATAIGEIGKPAGLPLLQPLLERGGEARWPALEAAARIFGSAPETPVPTWLREGCWAIQTELIERWKEEPEAETARLLGIAGTPDTAHPLLDALPDADLRPTAAVGLEMLPEDLRSKLVLEHLATAEAGVATVLLEIAPPPADRAAGESIAGHLASPDAECRAAAAEALARGDESLVLEILARLVQRPEMRIGAAITYGRLGVARCDPLVDLLRDPDPEVRVAAAEGLARCGGGLEAEVLHALRNERDGAARRALIGALGTMAGPKAVAELERLSGTGDPSIRFAALIALGRTAAPLALDPLLSALHDPLPQIRVAALNALRELGDARASGAVGESLAESDRDLRRTAALALGRLAAPATLAPLLRALHDVDREVRLAAIETLQRFPLPGVAAALRELADREVDPLVRSAARNAATPSEGERAS